MVFVLQLIVNTITVMISVGFFQFASNSMEFKNREHLNRLNRLCASDSFAILALYKFIYLLTYLTHSLTQL